MPLLFDITRDYVLEDERALIRPLQKSDVEFLLPFALNEPEIWKYSSRSGATKEGIEKYVNDAVDNRAAGIEYPFITFDKKANQYAGSTRFYDIQIANGMLQLGYTWYGGAYQGTGLNKHCKYLLLQFIFETMQAERLEFRADNNNARSIAAMKSIGCTVEGVLRSNVVRPDGGRRDSIVLSILKDEWFNGGKQNLAAKL